MWKKLFLKFKILLKNICSFFTFVFKKIINWFCALKIEINSELKTTIFSSRLRTIKYIIICLIPFLYGFFFIWAYWNPIENVSLIPMAIVNKDNSVCYSLNRSLPIDSNANPLQIYPDIQNKDICLSQSSSSGNTTYYYNSLTDLVFKQMITDKINNKISIQKPGTELDINAKYLYGSDTNFSPYDKYWTQIKLPNSYTIDLLHFFQGITYLLQLSNPLPNGNLDNVIDKLMVPKKIISNNIKLLTGHGIKSSDVNFTAAEKTAYISNGGYMNSDGSLTIDDESAKLHNLKFWSTYKFNFLGGQFMYIFNEFKYSLLNSLLPTTINTALASTVLPNIKLTDQEVKYNHLDPNYQWVSQNRTDIELGRLKGIYNSVEVRALVEIIKNIFPSATNFLNNIDSRVISFLSNPVQINNLFITGQSAFIQNNSEYVKDMIVNDISFKGMINNLLKGTFIPYDGNDFIQNRMTGKEIGEYGIGLGEFFICIALWVGVLMQTFVIERNRRSLNVKPSIYYFSKLSTMWLTSLIQCCVFLLSLLIIGFTGLGTSFLLYLLWMFLSVMVFTTIIHSLWLIPTDGDVGKFISVIYMILNLAGGWGTFPPFMQDKFFEIISYVMPFTYVLHGQGTIIYGVGILGQSAFFTGQIFQWLGILLIFVAVFITLGLFICKFRLFYERYQTFSKYVIYNALRELNYEYPLKNLKVIIKHDHFKLIGKINLEFLLPNHEEKLKQKVMQIKNNKKPQVI